MKFLLFCNCSAKKTKSAKRGKKTINIPSLPRVLRLFVVPLHFGGFDRVDKGVRYDTLGGGGTVEAPRLSVYLPNRTALVLIAI